MNYLLKHNAWYGGAPVKISLPDDWEVTYCGMEADRRRPLDYAAMKERMDHPYGSPRVLELAKGKKDVAILFDDMSRGTPCQDIAEIMLDELHTAGVGKEHIRFLCATGSHGTCTRGDFEKKLGKHIVKEYAVFNHNPFQNCVFCGETSGGIKLYINEELMKCDLKLGIGSISPHPVNGFGGGGKIALIGMAGIDTIEQLHAASSRYAREHGISFTDGIGNLDHCGMRLQIEEGVRMIGLDYKVDAVLNSNCDIVELTAGDPVEEYRAGADISARLNSADTFVGDMDVVIANANVKSNEAAIALGIANTLLKPEGGTMVLVDHNPAGQVVHHLGGAAGYYIGGRGFHGFNNRFPKAKHVIFFTPYPDLSSAMTFGDAGHITTVESWEEACSILKCYGRGTRAAVLSDATILSLKEKKVAET